MIYIENGVYLNHVKLQVSMSYVKESLYSFCVKSIITTRPFPSFFGVFAEVFRLAIIKLYAPELYIFARHTLYL